MNESTLHLRNVFQLPLQTLSDVMRVAQAHGFRKYDVYPDEKVVSEVIGSHCLDVRNVGIVMHGHPSHLGQKVWVRCVPRQHLDLHCGQQEGKTEAKKQRRKLKNERTIVENKPTNKQTTTTKNSENGRWEEGE